MHSRSTAFVHLFLLLALGCQRSAPETPAAVEPGIIQPEELLARIADGTAPLILDTRSAEEFAAGHVEGAELLAFEGHEALLAERNYARDREIVVYCRSGRRAGIVESAMREAGYTNLRHLAGDILDWKAKGRPLVSP